MEVCSSEGGRLPLPLSEDGLLLPSASLPHNPWSASAPSLSASSALSLARVGASYSVTSKTHSRYRVAFDRFAAFCSKAGYPSLPAPTQAILAFAGHVMELGQARSLPHLLGAVSHYHITHGFWSPTNHPAVTQTRKGVARWVAQHQPRTVAWRLPLRPEHLRDCFSRVGHSDDPWTVQAIALLSFGLRIGQRASTLGNLQLSDVRFLAEHVDVYIARSKTDQEGQGRHIFVEYPDSSSSPLHPVVALQRHIRVNGILSGPLFRSFTTSGHCTQRALGGRGVNLVVKWCCYDTLKLDGLYSGHSIRIGSATAMSEAGVEDHVIRRTCGWTGPYAQTYLRFSRPSAGNLSRSMGLF